MAEGNLSKRLRRSLVAYAALGMLCIGAIVAAVTWIPLYQHLQQDAKVNLTLAAHSQSQLVAQYLWRIEEIAEQIASRSAIREKLQAYNNHSLARAELINFTRSSLADALQESPEIVGIARLDRTGETVVQLGMPIPPELRSIPAIDATEAIVSPPIRIDDLNCFLVATAIVNPQSRQRVGTDLVVFQVAVLEEIIQKLTAPARSNEIFLATRNGDRVDRIFPLGLDSADNPSPDRQSDRRFASSLQISPNSQTGLLFTESGSGNGEAIAYSSIPKSDWLLLLKVPTAVLYQPINRHIAIASGMMLGFILLATGGMVVLLHPLTGEVAIRADELERTVQEQTASLQRELEERRNAEGRLAARARESAVVSRLGQWALAGMDLKTLMEEAAKQVTQILDVEFCWVWELLDDGSALRLQASSTVFDPAVDVPIVCLDMESQAGYTLLSKKPIASADLRQEERFKRSEFLERYGVVSGISAIVQGQEGAFGVLAAHSTQVRQFGDDDIHFMQAIANVLATAIDVQHRESALRESEERYALAVEGANDGLWDWNLKTNQIYFSPRWKSMLGYPPERIGDRPEDWFDLVHPEDLDNLRIAIADCLEGITPHFKSEHRILDAEGNYCWMLSRGLTVRDAYNKPYRMAGSQTDISDRKAAEERNIRLAAFPKYNPNPVLACDFHGEILYVNPATERILEELCVGLATGFLPINHRQLVKTCLQQGHPGLEVERIVHDRVFYWLYYPLISFQIVHLHVIEITDRALAQDRLRYEALHDNLTGLPNRAFFLKGLHSALARTIVQPDYLFAVVFLDLDRFKVVNDSLGHFIGDRLLIALAERLQQCVNPGNILARFGGDEFTILLHNLKNIEEAIAVADRIHSQFAAPFNLNGYEVFTTASIGIVPSSLGYQRPEDVLRDADLAMYRAKAKGKARHEVFDRKMLDRALAQLNLENDLRRAIFKNLESQIARDRQTEPSDSTPPSPTPSFFSTTRYSSQTPREDGAELSEFILHYQPIVTLDTGLVSGFEALIRWQHPERGLISPVEFIPLTEETGLILPLGEWVLREACWQMRRWQELFDFPEPLTMSVNLSGQQLSQPDLIARIDRILAETGVDPSCLKLEITESVLMENAASAAQLLEQLRSRHIHLCIDDFGTGYSSLSHLAQFPINTLKIDKSFVMGMDSDNENSEIVRAIATLAHNLGMYVTAEGVEKEEHLVQLWALHCDYGQGYFFSQALDRNSAEELLKRSPRW